MIDNPKRASRIQVRVEKRPGDDWMVDVLIKSQREVYPVAVFGAEDEAETARDALSSFSPERSGDLAVVGIERLIDRAC